MTTWTRERLERLISGGVPESAALEYKEALPLGTRPEKLEALKDLSGMANGGGGTVIFGMSEEDGDWPTASALGGLTDRTLPGRLEDIVRAGVQPPLLAAYTIVELDVPAYALIVGTERSPLGPNMVDAYGTRTYHRRTGTRTFPMSETEVRDAYQLAMRLADRRADQWARHDLPLGAPTGDPWLLVSAVPTDPLRDVLDLRRVHTEELIPPTEPSVYLNNWDVADLTPALRSLAMWSDGFFSDDLRTDGSLSRLVRLHRDGSVALGIQLERSGNPTPVSLVRVSRVLNGLLRYLGWMWDRFAVHQRIELHLRVRRTDVVAFVVDDDGVGLMMPRPNASSVDAVEHTFFLTPAELLRASTRHRVVHEFADRLAQAFGRPGADYPFRMGELYGRSGESIGISAGTDALYGDQAGHIAWIREGGVVHRAHDGQPVGRWNDGVLTGSDGRVLAVLELATGHLCPDEFAAISLRASARGVAANFHQGHPEPAVIPDDLPAAVPEWSDAQPLSSIRGW
jgi:hypothetical protein